MEFMVGLFVLAGFVALLFVSLQAANLGNFSFSAKTYEVTANFDNIGGLKARAPVKSAGVVVGRVRDITFDQSTFQATVKMDLDSGYKFPADTSARFSPRACWASSTSGCRPGATTVISKRAAKSNRHSRRSYWKT